MLEQQSYRLLEVRGVIGAVKGAKQREILESRPTIIGAEPNNPNV
jgi:hypothetical protein